MVTDEREKKTEEKSNKLEEMNIRTEDGQALKRAP